MTVDNIKHSRRITIRKKHQRKKRRENIRVENMSWQKNTESHSRYVQQGQTDLFYANSKDLIQSWRI